MPHERDTEVDDIIGVNNRVSDDSIKTGLWISSTIGTCVLLIFCVAQRTSLLYQYRLVAHHVRVKPPCLRRHGLVSFIDWAIKAITISDVDFVQTAGLDALIMVKLCALGVQMLLPPCLLGLLVLIPLHWNGSEVHNTDVYHSGFMRLTMANFPVGSAYFWIHVVFIYLYMGWSMLLLRWHYHQYLTIRQHYLKKGDDVNLWRALYESHPSDGISRDRGDLRSFLHTMPLIKALLPSGVPTDSLVVQSGVEPIKDSDGEEVDAGDGLTGVQPPLAPSLVHVRSRRYPPSSVGRSLTSTYSLADRPRRSHKGASTTAGASGDQELLSRRSVPVSSSSAAAASAPPRPPTMSGDSPEGAREASLRLQLTPAPFHSGDGKRRPYGLRGSHAAHERAAQRHSAQLPRVDSEGQDLPEGEGKVAIGVAGEATGGKKGAPLGRGGSSPGGKRRSRSSAGVGAGPVAEGVEGVDASGIELAPLPVEAPAASSDLARLPAPAAPAFSNDHPDLRDASSAPLPLATVIPSVPRAGPPLEVEVNGAADGGRGSRPNSDKSRYATLVAPGSNDARDIEVGLPTSSRVLDEGDFATAAVVMGPPAPSWLDMSRDGSIDDLLDEEAHFLEWWWGGGELVQRDGSGGGECGAGLVGQEALALSRSWPSVSHRKTVNAISRGQQRAVLAQHYAVLVMDVMERKPAAKGSRDEPGERDAQAKPIRLLTRRLASYLPLCLRSWCNPRYGQQAARKMALEATSVASSDASAHASSLKPLSLGSGANSALRKYSNGPPPKTPPARPLPITAVRDGGGGGRHRRNFSAGDALLPSTVPPAAPRQFSGPRPAVPYGGDGGRSASPTGQPNGAALRPGPGLYHGQGGIGEVPQLLRLFDLMAERARSARDVALSRSSTGSPRGLLQPSRLSRSGQTGSTIEPANSTLHRGEFSLPVLHRRPGARPAAGTAGGDAAAGAPHHPLAQAQVQAKGLLGDVVHGIETTGRLDVQARGGPAQPAVRPLPEAGTENTVVIAAAAAAAAKPGMDTRGPGPVAEAEELQPSPRSSGGKGGGDIPDPPAPGEHIEPPTVEPHAASNDVAPGRKSLLRRRRLAEESRGSAADIAAAGAEEGSVKAGGSDAGSSASGSGASKWGLVREAVYDGRIAMLPRRSSYSVVSATFSRLFPGEFDRAIPVINYREVDLLLMRVDFHLAKYEYARVYEQSTGKKLYGRIGFCGLFGERKRLRTYHMEEVNKLMGKVREARRRAFAEGQTPSWFVFFHTQRAAAMASQCLIHAEDNRQFRVHPAPGPDEVNWPALWSDFSSRDLRRNLMRPLVALVVLIPVGVFGGALMQLNYLLCPKHFCVDLDPGSKEWVENNCSMHTAKRERAQVTWDWYCEQEDFLAKGLKEFVVGWLPSLLVTLWQGMILPLFFTFTVQTSRQARSLSDADRAIAKNMFYFAVFNVFLGGVVGSTIIQGINSAINKGPSEIFNLIGTYLPTSSNFFINYTLFRAFVALPLRMLWPHIGIRLYLLRRYLRCSCIMTQRERAFLMAPVSPRYGFEVGMIMLIFLIAFAFSVVSPLLLPLAVVFFAMAWLFWRWALLYVYVRKYESGGTMFPFIYRCIMVCLGIFPVFTACVFVTKEAYTQAIIVLITTPIILIRFNSYCYYRFQSGMNAMPLEATVRAPLGVVEPWVYYPPPLLPNLAGWNPDWSKCWQGWNLPVVYG